MSDFIERRNEYFKKLKENSNVVNLFTPKDGASENAIKTYRMMILPQNEEELDTADSFFSIISDTINLYEDVDNGSVKNIPFEENEGLEYCINVINYKKENGIDKDLNNSISIEEFAKLKYQFLLASFYDGESIHEYIASKTGFDLEDDIDAIQYELYVEKINDYFGSLIISFENVYDAKRFAKIFHELYEDGKKNVSLERNIG